MTYRIYFLLPHTLFVAYSPSKNAMNAMDSKAKRRLCPCLAISCHIPANYQPLKSPSSVCGEVHCHIDDTEHKLMLTSPGGLKMRCACLVLFFSTCHCALSLYSMPLIVDSIPCTGWPPEPHREDRESTEPGHGILPGRCARSGWCCARRSDGQCGRWAWECPGWEGPHLPRSCRSPMPGIGKLVTVNEAVGAVLFFFLYF